MAQSTCTGASPLLLPDQHWPRTPAPLPPHRGLARLILCLALLPSSVSSSLDVRPDCAPRSHLPIASRDLICFSGGLEPLTRIVAQGLPPRPPPVGTPQREAAYRAAGALENLSSDHSDNAQFIVAAGVVPAMQELLIGGGATDLSQKAARKARAALYALIAMNKAARAQSRQADVEREAASLAAQALAHACASAAVLEELSDSCRDEGGGDGSDRRHGPRRSDSRASFEARATMARIQSELDWLGGDPHWTHEVLTYAENLSQSSLGYGSSRPLGTEEVRPPAPLEVADDKARRTAIHLVFKRAPLGQLLSSRMDYDGRLVVEARRA